MSRDWLLYLDDIVQSAEKIGSYVQGLSYEEFRSNDVVLDAVLFNLQVIGEAAKKLPYEAIAAMPEVEWASAAGFRDIIVHHYFALDTQIVWDVVVDRIPELLRVARTLLERIDKSRQA